ncbi:hypothetical protein HanIR_Chr05g0212351 [Helianthus annuus]|nr:hypothetical protein HanIR_Chr05g0212351 [Helianthus annuus]
MFFFPFRLDLLYLFLVQVRFSFQQHYLSQLICFCKIIQFV